MATPILCLPSVSSWSRHSQPNERPRNSDLTRRIMCSRYSATCWRCMVTTSSDLIAARAPLASRYRQSVMSSPSTPKSLPFVTMRRPRYSWTKRRRITSRLYDGRGRPCQTRPVPPSRLLSDQVTHTAGSPGLTSRILWRILPQEGGRETAVLIHLEMGAALDGNENRMDRRDLEPGDGLREGLAWVQALLR